MIRELIIKVQKSWSMLVAFILIVFYFSSQSSVCAVDKADAAHVPIRDKWAIVIGINKFQDKRIPELRYSVKDAEDFADFLVKKEKFAPDHVLLLRNEDATEDFILDAVGDNWLPRRVLPGDLVVIYASTHGSPKEMDVAGENFLIAYNTKVDRLFASGIKLSDLAPTIKKRTGCDRIVMILDACNSGAADVGGGKGLIRSQNFNVDSLIGEGMVIISSSAAEQRSWESQRYNNGVFTKCLMEALQANGESTSLSQAFDIMKDKVEQEVRYDRRVAQTPVLRSKWIGPALLLAATPTRPRQVDATGAMVTSTTPTGQLQSGQPWFGIKATPITQETMKSMGLTDAEGVLVAGVVAEAPAAKAGFRPGDILLKIDGYRIRGPGDVVTCVQAHSVGDRIYCLVQRDTGVVTVPIELAALPEGRVPAMQVGSVATANGNTSSVKSTTTISAGMQGESNNSIGTQGGLNNGLGTNQSVGAIQNTGLDRTAGANQNTGPDPTVGSNQTIGTQATTSGPISIAMQPGQNLQGTVIHNATVLENRVAIFYFAAPQEYKLSKSNDYPKDFCDQDRQRLSYLPGLISQAVSADLSSRLGQRFIPVQNSAQFVHSQAPDLRIKEVAQAVNAKYIICGRLDQFSFSARVKWSNEYQFKTTVYICNGETGQVIAIVPTSYVKTPWLGDSTVWFTDYIERRLLPELAKKIADDIIKKIPNN